MPPLVDKYRLILALFLVRPKLNEQQIIFLIYLEPFQLKLKFQICELGNEF